MAPNNLKLVTFTGADDSTKADVIREIAEKYPDTEWGILFGAYAGINGAPRFPSEKWLAEELPKLKGLNLSAHLCGRCVNDLVIRGDFTWPYIYGHDVTDLFKRIQLNFHGIEGYSIHVNTKKFYTRIEDEPYKFIFQQDGINDHLLHKDLIVDTGIGYPLYDMSHGAGDLPDAWPSRKYNVLSGWAGGLGPKNIKKQLDAITKAAGSLPFWIDMETKVRSDKDKLFDLDKVREVCSKIWG